MGLQSLVVLARMSEGDILTLCAIISDGTRAHVIDILAHVALSINASGRISARCSDLHIQSNLTNQLGVRGLRHLCLSVMKELDFDAIEIIGARRTTGAGPGRTPRPLRFARSDPAEG
jgi:hypothetical protein